MSSAKLYVGNLNYATTEASIRALFEQHGEVSSVNLITDRDSGRPKGFGFVEMPNRPEAEAAIRSGGYGGGGYGGGGYGGGRNW